MPSNTSQAQYPVAEIAMPPSSSIAKFYGERPDLGDAFAIPIADGASNDPDCLARHLNAHPAPWVGGLLKLRDVMVAPFGIKSTRQFEAEAVAADIEHIGFFRVCDRRADEIVFGQADSHLDFRGSLLVLPADSQHPRRRVAVVTVVRCNNLVGKVYLALITPFHRRVVMGNLRQAAQAGWPPA